MLHETNIANIIAFSHEPVKIDSLYYLNDKVNKGLGKAVFKNNAVYYRGRFYPMNCFVFTNGEVQLSAEVKQDPDKYCLQRRVVYLHSRILAMREDRKHYSGRESRYSGRESRYSGRESRHPHGINDWIQHNYYNFKNENSIEKRMNSFREAVHDMPDDLGGALNYIRLELHLTNENFESISGLSERTIRRIQTEPDYRPKLKTVVAICVSLHLHPFFSQELLRRAGYEHRNAKTEAEKAYWWLINICFDSSFDECNRYLRDQGFEPLSKNEVTEFVQLMEFEK